MVLKDKLNRLLALQAEKFVGEIGLSPAKQTELTNLINSYRSIEHQLRQTLLLHMTYMDDVAGHGLSQTDEDISKYNIILIGLGWSKEESENYYQEMMFKHDQL